MTDQHRRWWLKAAAQGALSLAPGGARLADRLRSWLPGGQNLDGDYAVGKWRHVAAHTKAATGDAEGDLTGARVVELGTGWFPVVPVGLALRGADVVTIDTSGHLDPRRVRSTLAVVADLVEEGAVTVRDRGRVDLLRSRLHEGVTSVPDLLHAVGVTPKVADARDLSTVSEAWGADVMVSNNTLEHIPPEVIAGILAEFHRTAGPSARMSHYIDLADHYAGVDPRIGEFHFLTLHERAWRLANNRLHYQNRLRITDYRDLLTSSGWRIVAERLTRRDPAALSGLALVPPFDSLPVADVRVVKAHLVAARA